VGLRVPVDVSVVGFDDHPMAPYFDLTTVAQDVRGQGRRIAQHLVEAVSRAAQGLAPEPVELRASTHLVVRGTTAVARRPRSHNLGPATPARTTGADGSWAPVPGGGTGMST